MQASKQTYKKALFINSVRKVKNKLPHRIVLDVVPSVNSICVIVIVTLNIEGMKQVLSD